MRFRILLCLCLFATEAAQAGGTSPVPSPEDQNRQVLIDQFTVKQESLNWPEKFQRIGEEMDVPPDVLAAIAFTETRWEQLTWPPGETVSPETGHPLPYGVMSLWDNDVLGHSLIDAAALIGSTPDALKADPDLNIRGAAALLRKYYDSNPLPEGTTTNDIESWQNAIVKYCGIPDPWLAFHHVVNCYRAMSLGYDQYGMHWKPHPVNMDPMRARLKKLLADHDAHVALPEPQRVTLEPTLPFERVEKPVPNPPVAIVAPPPPQPEKAWKIPLVFGGLAFILAYALMRSRKKSAG